MSLVATLMQNLRVSDPEFDRNMTRPQEYGALDFFMQQTYAPNSIINEELLRRAEMSIGRTLQIPVINYDGNVTVSNTRSCTIPCNPNTSELVTVVFVDYTTGFCMYPGQHMNNEITYAQDYRRSIEKIVRALGNALDTTAVSVLEANKTQVFNNPLYYDIAGNTVNVPFDMRMEILADLDVMMRANNFNRRMHVIGNSGIDSLLLKLAQHGIYNDVNKRNEWDNKIFHYTNNIANAEGQFGTGFAVEDGNVGVLFRYDRQSLLGTSVPNHEWSIERLPIIGVPASVHYETAVGDFSSQTGNPDQICDVVEKFGFTVSAAFLFAYNSDPATIPNPDIKFQIAGNSTNRVGLPVTIVNGEGNPVITQSTVGTTEP